MKARTAASVPCAPDGEATHPVLEVRGLTVSASRSAGPTEIATEIDFDVAAGEAIAIVGESGSGKSLVTRAILDLLPNLVEYTGRVTFEAIDLRSLGNRERRALRGSGMALVMQDPFTMLNPLQRCGSQIVAALQGGKGATRLSATDVRSEAVRRLAEVGITDESVVYRYPYELSGGMRQRVAIAAAIAENPRLLIADESTTALDVTTQREILELLDTLRITYGLGLVLVTHDLGVAFSVCDRIYVMYAGTVVETGTAEAISSHPRHPYTKSLIAAHPRLDVREARLRSIAGSVPPPGSRPAGCRFAPRCPWVAEVCGASLPRLDVVAEDHLVRCGRAHELGDVRLPAATLEPSITVSGPVDGSRDAEQLVKFRDVETRFGSKLAVGGVDLDVFAGESVGLVGESGSGKTTLARMMVGLTVATSGVTEVGGVHLGGVRMRRRDREVVQRTAQMAFQDPNSTLNAARSVGSTLKEALRLADRADVNRRAAELLDMVGLSSTYLDRRPAQLSGGECQRVAIARALARRPRLLVCDEVVSALDVSLQAHILNLLNDLRRDLGIAYVFITHDLAVVRQVTDRLYVLKAGRIVEQGPTGSVLDTPEHSYTRTLVASIPRY